MFDMPWADAWVTMDCPFIKNNERFLSKPSRVPLYIALPTVRAVGPAFAPEIKRATYIRRASNGDRISQDPCVLECGGTSGYTALNFAYLRWAREIYLFGFDYQETPGAAHYCPERYAWRDDRDYAQLWKTWRQAFNGAALQMLDVEITNASLHSAIDAFPRCTPYEALRELEHDRYDATGT